MPKREESPNALIYRLETPYIAIAEDTSSCTAPLTKEDLESCVGSRNFAICLNHFAISANPTSCVANLKLGNLNRARSTCKVQSIPLPSPEQATNLGRGKWLITAANTRFKMRIFEKNEETNTLPGCQVCFIKIPCGGRLKTDYLSIQADSAACVNQTTMKINVKMAEPLQHLISSLPPIEEIPHQPTIEAAETALIEEVQSRMARSLDQVPEMSNARIDEIAAPNIQSYTRLRRPIREGFSGTVKNHISISMTITSFIVSMICQIGFHYLKPWIPCLQATRIGMMTEAELKKISKRRMAHPRLIFYETPNGKILILSHKKSKECVPLQVAGEEVEMTTNCVKEETRSAADTPRVANTADAKSEGFYPNLYEVDL